MHRQIFIFILQNWVSQGGNYDGSYDRYFRSIVREKVKINSVGRETLVLTEYSSLLIGPTPYSPPTPVL